MNDDCLTIHELIPAYALGATDPAESRLVETHLAGCSDAAAELADYELLAEAMLFSAPQLAAPASLENTFRLATADARTSAVQPAQHRPALADRIRALLTFPKLHPLPTLAALALVALLFVNVIMLSQLGTLQESVSALTTLAANQTSVLSLVTEGEFLRVSLPPGPAGIATGAYATVVCNPEEPFGFIRAEKLPPLQPGQVYQVWLAVDNQFSSGGVFEIDQAGNGSTVFQAALPMGQYQQVGITVEPAGGSPAPTLPAYILGDLYGPGYHG